MTIVHEFEEFLSKNDTQKTGHIPYDLIWKHPQALGAGNEKQEGEWKGRRRRGLLYQRLVQDK